MSTSNKPEDTIFIDEMECVPIDELTGKEKDFTNEESENVCWVEEKQIKIILHFLVHLDVEVLVWIFYGIVIIGFIYSVGDIYLMVCLKEL